MTEVLVRDNQQPHLIEQAAVSAVTSVEFDYFASRGDASVHAKAEGIDPANFVETAQGYTRVPRLYPANLGHAMGTAFEMVASGQEQPFVHSDAYGLTVGMIRPATDGHDKQPSLVTPSPHRSYLRIPMSDTKLASMAAPLDVVREPWDPDAEWKRGAVELRLGRNMLVNGSYEDAERAARDTYRQWEAVFAIGPGAVLAYVMAMQAANAKRGESSILRSNPENTSRAKALQVLSDKLLG